MFVPLPNSGLIQNQQWTVDQCQIQTIWHLLAMVTLLQESMPLSYILMICSSCEATDKLDLEPFLQWSWWNRSWQTTDLNLRDHHKVATRCRHNQKASSVRWVMFPAHEMVLGAYQKVFQMIHAASISSCWSTISGLCFICLFICRGERACHQYNKLDGAACIDNLPWLNGET